MSKKGDLRKKVIVRWMFAIICAMGVMAIAQLLSTCCIPALNQHNFYINMLCVALLVVLLLLLNRHEKIK